MTGLDLSADGVEALARKLYGEPNRRLSTRRELRFGRHGSLSVIPSRGVFQDHEAGAAGGVLDMIVHAGQARSRVEARRLLEADGIVAAQERPQERRQREAAEIAEAERRWACAASLWAARRPLSGSLAETYLRSARDIAAPLDAAEIGFLAGAPVWPYLADCQDRRPAMVARVADAAGDLIGAHLTYLRPDGLGKATLPVARKAVGKVGGGFIRLACGDRLVVAEGIESALSAWEAAGAAHGLGCVAAISAEGLARLSWPDRTTGLIIAPDQDASGTGEAAAQRLALRAHASGLSVAFLRPPKPFGDWNAWAQAMGGAA